MSGKLYQQGIDNPVRTETYRSKPAGGKTPSDRLNAAAQDAFEGLAAMFVQPPPAFDLPVPIETAAPETDEKGDGKTPTGTKPKTPTMAKPDVMPMAPAPLPSTASPNVLPGTPGMPLVPQLPPAAPPLGVGAGEATPGR